MTGEYRDLQGPEEITNQAMWLQSYEILELKQLCFLHFVRCRRMIYNDLI